jgi:hypothetical protein
MFGTLANRQTKTMFSRFQAVVLMRVGDDQKIQSANFLL